MMEVPVYSLGDVLTMNPEYVPVFIQSFGLDRDLQLPGGDARGAIAIKLSTLGKLTYPDGINISNLPRLINETSPANEERTKRLLLANGIMVPSTRLQLMQIYNQILLSTEGPINPDTIPQYTLDQILAMNPKFIPLFVEKLGITSDRDLIGSIILSLATLGKVIYPEGINSDNIAELVHETDPSNGTNAKFMIKSYGMTPSDNRYKLMLQYLRVKSMIASSPRELYMGQLLDIGYKMTLYSIFSADPSTILKPGETSIDQAILRLQSEGRLQLEPPINSENLAILLLNTTPLYFRNTLAFIQKWLNVEGELVDEVYLKTYRGTGIERVKLMIQLAEAMNNQAKTVI